MNRDAFDEICRRAWLPPVKQLAEEWIPAHVRTPPGSEFDGLLSYDVAPHTREVFRAWDNDRIREIYLCWGTRNMKTTTAIALAIFAAVTAPRPMAFGSANEQILERTLNEQIYPMLEACDRTKFLVPPEGKRPKDVIKLERCRIRKAWGGSPASVSGYPAAYLFGSEWDKWPKKKSKEAAPKNAYLQRKKGFPFVYKVLLESAPSTVDDSEIWEAIHAAHTDHRWWYVPCIHCEEFQFLEWERLIYDAGEGKRPDVMRAIDTAHYLCLHCGERLENDDRPTMQRAGKWVSDGQTIDKRGRLHGDPTCPDSPFVGFGPLSSLNSLLISGWGQLVGDWLKCGNDEDQQRDFINSTLSRVWDPKPKKVEVHVLAERLFEPRERGLIPNWVYFLTEASDVGRIGEGLQFYWQVCCWGKNRRGGLLDFGLCAGNSKQSAQAQFLEHIAHDSWTREDGLIMRPVRRGIDSSDGVVTNTVYKLCEQIPYCFPLKGDDSEFPGWYRWGFKHEGELARVVAAKKRMNQGDLLLINNQRSQSWRWDLVQGRIEKNAPDWWSMPQDICESKQPEHADLLDEFMADYPQIRKNSKGEYETAWIKGGPANEFGDMARYNRALAELFTRGGKLWDSIPAPITGPDAEQQKVLVLSELQAQRRPK